jgi:urease accessory protein
MNTTRDSSEIRLLRLLQLSSATLPVGAYAYSHGLEHAANRGWVSDEDSLGAWTCGLIEHSLGTLDVPVLGRLWKAWLDADESTARRWMRFCSACRGSAELVEEERRLGIALAVAELEIDVGAAANALLFAWAENQVACATRLLPLGQLAAQRVLSRAVQMIPGVVDNAASLADGDLCSSAVGLGIASALHETQYCRLFRS